ncbi:hypothetical protein Ciccas_011286 [Cichlidogyrus casuarinus]|uniref:Uncharacterized protein n=1 Tax=Cichlidogyrus casuarinus TaxID=1844966 RepID=A0ABD2PTQ7_9PLAT
MGFGDYEGLFTSHMSIDIGAKIMLSLLLFIAGLFFLAWCITYKVIKKYRLAKLLSKEYWLKSYSSLYSFKVIRQFACEKAFTQFSALKINSIFCTLIGERKAHSECDYHIFFNSQETAASNAFSLKWLGLVFSKCFNEHYGPLRLMTKQCFDSVSPSSILFAVKKIKSTTHTLLEDSTLDPTEELVWTVISEFYFQEHNLDSEAMLLKSDFLQSVRFLIEDAFLLHSTGSIVFKGEKITEEKFLSSVEATLGPLLAQIGNSLVQEEELNFAQKLFSKRAEISVELEDSSRDRVGLSTMHLLIDSLMVLQYSLTRALNVLMFAFASRPDWIQLIRSDAHAPTCEHSDDKFPETCLSVENLDCFPWLKAFTFEAMRVSCAGWPFGSIRRILRDVRFRDLDLQEDHLLLFNEPAFFSKAWVHATDGDRCSQFNPSRHLVKADDRFLVHISNYWARVLLDSDCLGVTRKFMRWTLMMLVHEMIVCQKVSVTFVNTPPAKKPSKQDKPKRANSLSIPENIYETKLIR